MKACVPPEVFISAQARRLDAILATSTCMGTDAMTTPASLLDMPNLSNTAGGWIKYKEEPDDSFNVDFFGKFAESMQFDEESERYYTIPDMHSNDAVRNIKAALEDPSVFVIKFAGKNSIKDPDHLKTLQEDVNRIVTQVIAKIVEDQPSKVILISEGDNYEESAPFSIAMFNFLQMCNDNNIQVNFVMVKEPNVKGFSKGYFETWKKALEPMPAVLENTFFGVSPNYSMMTFNVCHTIVFLGTTMDEKYMWRNKEEQVMTTGFKHYSAIKDGGRFDMDVKSPSLSVFTRKL